MHSSPDIDNTKPDVAKLALLADFCKEELAAVETYKKALTLMPLHRHTDLLARCYASHQNRANELRERIVALGGKPPNAPGHGARSYRPSPRRRRPSARTSPSRCSRKRRIAASGVTGSMCKSSTPRAARSSTNGSCPAKLRRTRR